jgi:hypothetical protein
LGCYEESEGNLNRESWDKYTTLIGVQGDTGKNLFLITTPNGCSSCQEEISFFKNNVDKTDIHLIIKSKSKDLYKVYATNLDSTINIYQDTTDFFDNILFKETYYLRVFTAGKNEIFYSNGFDFSEVEYIVGKANEY